jgi:hypothetical protein
LKAEKTHHNMDFISSLEFGKFALYDKKTTDDNITRFELLHFPQGCKRHRIIAGAKAVGYAEPGTGVAKWQDQWGRGIAKYLIEVFTTRGEMVGDMFCGTGTLSWQAIRMGRSAVAVDILPEAIKITNIRLGELKATIETETILNFVSGHNPISYLSYIPEWDRIDLREVGEREKKRNSRIKKRRVAEEKRTKKEREAAAKERLAQERKLDADVRAAVAEHERKDAEEKLADAQVNSQKSASQDDTQEDDDEEKADDGDEKQDEQPDQAPEPEIELDPIEQEDEDPISELDISTIVDPQADAPDTPAATRSRTAGAGDKEK